MTRSLQGLSERCLEIVLADGQSMPVHRAGRPARLVFARQGRLVGTAFARVLCRHAVKPLNITFGLCEQRVAKGLDDVAMAATDSVEQ